MPTQQGRTPKGVTYSVRGTGPPLLWLPGFVVPASAFDHVVSGYEARYRVIAVDHRGSGTSGTPLLPITTATMASDVLAVMDELGVASANVVGISLGGMVAQQLALMAPHRVHTLALCSTTAGGMEARTPPLRDLVGELQQTASRLPGRFRFRLLGALHQAAAASTHDSSRQLWRILVPTLVLHGDHDSLVPVANATWLESQIGGAELRIVQGGDHLLLLDSPVARQVLWDWLDLHGQRIGGIDPREVGPARLPGAAICRALWNQTLPLRRLLQPWAGDRRQPITTVSYKYRHQSEREHEHG